MHYQKRTVWVYGFFIISIMVIFGSDNCRAQNATILRPAEFTRTNEHVPALQSPLENLPESEGYAARYIDIDELEPGMRGYGLTVFSGSEIGRFEVELVSVMHNFEPKRNAFIIRCLDERFRLAKMVRGVSGSPVFFKNRLAGAMAFGWPFSEEPLYGVTPIREMLQIRQTKPKSEKDDWDRPAASRSVLERHLYTDLMRRQLLSDDQVQALAVQAGLARSSFPENPEPDASGMVCLPVTMSMGGFSPKTLEVLRQRIPGLIFQAGLGTAGTIGKVPEASKKIKMEPGASLIVPLIMGDMSGQVLGTVTEVVGDEVFGFGHAWNGEGGAAWPMATGYIHTFVSRKDASFKLGEAVEVIGAIRADEAPAIYGRIGADYSMIPMQVEVQWFDRQQPEVFQAQIADDEQRDAFLAVSVVLNSIIQRGGLPREHTLHYQMEFEFDKVEPIRFENMTSGSGVGDVFGDVLDPVMLILGNPWEKVKLTAVKVKAQVSDENNVWTIKSAQLSQLIYRPGDNIRAQLIVMPLREQERQMEIEMKLPSDLQPGKYRLNIGSLEDYRLELRKAQPHKYHAFNADDVQRILQERLSQERNGVYMSMILPRRGVAIEDLALEDLPGSKTMLLTDDSRKITTTPFQPMISASVVTEAVVMGGVNFEIEVRREY